jgi:hypothetical protein
VKGGELYRRETTSARIQIIAWRFYYNNLGSRARGDDSEQQLNRAFGPDGRCGLVEEE